MKTSTKRGGVFVAAAAATRPGFAPSGELIGVHQSHWVHERRTRRLGRLKGEAKRRRIYRRLLKHKATQNIARRARDWSDNHIALLIKANSALFEDDD